MKNTKTNFQNTIHVYKSTVHFGRDDCRLRSLTTHDALVTSEVINENAGGRLSILSEKKKTQNSGRKLGSVGILILNNNFYIISDNNIIIVIIIIAVAIGPGRRIIRT